MLGESAVWHQFSTCLPMLMSSMQMSRPGISPAHLQASCESFMCSIFYDFQSNAFLLHPDFYHVLPAQISCFWQQQLEHELFSPKNSALVQIKFRLVAS